MSLLATSIVKNSYILTEIYFMSIKKRPRPNLKRFQYQIWTSGKNLEIWKEVIK